MRPTVKTSFYLGLSFIIGYLLLQFVLGVLIWGYDDKSRFEDDKGANWYLWQLPFSSEVFRTILWTTYFIHLSLNFYMIYSLQHKINHSKTNKKYLSLDSPLRYENIALLITNAIAHILHLLYSHIEGFYNGLAIDTYLSASQASVILILVLVAAMESKSRGLFLGRWKFSPKGAYSEGIQLIRKLHAYPFLFGAVFTFWYHPNEPRASFLLGFGHTALFMLQASLAFTRIHLSPVLRLVLEAYVTVHGSVVAFEQANGQWPMFLFGFLVMGTCNQIYGLPGIKRTRTWHRHIAAWLTLVLILVYYLFVSDLKAVGLQEPIRIPMILIGFAALTVLVLRPVSSRIRSKPASKPGISVLVGVFWPWVIATVISIVGYQLEWELALILMMAVLVMVFDLLWVLGLFSMASLMAPPPPAKEKTGVEELKEVKGELKEVKEPTPQDVDASRSDVGDLEALEI